MNVRKGLQKVAAVVAALYVIDRFLLLGYISPPPEQVINPRIQEVMSTESYKYNFTDDNAALHYLKLANAITMKYLVMSYPPPADVNEALKQRVGQCMEASGFTYSNYTFLINAAGRSDLADKVRRATGVVYFNNDFGSHSWLEINIEGKWVPFETTSNDLPDRAVINPEAIDDLVPTGNVLLPLAYVGYSHDRLESSKLGRTYDLKEFLTGHGYFEFKAKTIARVNEYRRESRKLP